MTRRIYFGFNEWDASDFEAACYLDSLEEMQRLLPSVNWSVEKTAPLHAALLRQEDDEIRKKRLSLLLVAKSPVDVLAFVHAAQFCPTMIPLLPNPTIPRPDAPDHWRAALVALINGTKLDYVPRLLELGASPNAPDRDGWTALHHVCRWVDLAKFRALQGGPEKLDVHMRTRSGQTPQMVLESSPFYSRRRDDARVISAELKALITRGQ